MFLKKESIVEETEYGSQILEFIMTAFHRNKFGRCRAVVGGWVHTHQMFVRTKDVLTEIEYELNKAHEKFYHPHISAYIFS